MVHKFLNENLSGGTNTSLYHQFENIGILQFANVWMITLS